MWRGLRGFLRKRMGTGMDIVSSGCVTVQLGGTDRGAGPPGRLELVRRGLGCSRAISPKDNGFQGTIEGIGWLLDLKV